jgi:quaternary ammonium compound-resistance protein SugE
MAWILLILGGLFEVSFTTCLGKVKEATGTAAVLWLIGFLVSCGLSMYLLYKATSMQAGSIPMGTGYAVWAGIGAVGTAVVGMLIFKEPTDFWRIFFMLTLIASIVGLKLVAH